MPFLHYDAAKASIDEATTTERQHRIRFPFVICDRECSVDTIGHGQYVCWVHHQCLPFKRKQLLTTPRSDVADGLVNEFMINELNSDPG